MRYAIYFTPPANDPLSQLAASWLGRNSFSGLAVEPPDIYGFGIHEIAFHTALPRRQGFHGTLKAPFRLAENMSEAVLLKHLMTYAGSIAPFEIPRLEVARLGNFFGLAPSHPCERMNFLAAAVVQEFDRYRAPLSEAEIEWLDPDSLSAPQFSNLHRWGHPNVMEEFRFHMTLTGPVKGVDVERFKAGLHSVFDPLLRQPVAVANLALFVEEEPGAPFRVHSLHPMGQVSARRPARQRLSA
jgi:putative phosphonate metabolism protein